MWVDCAIAPGQMATSGCTLPMGELRNSLHKRKLKEDSSVKGVLLLCAEATYSRFHSFPLPLALSLTPNTLCSSVVASLTPTCHLNTSPPSAHEAPKIELLPGCSDGQAQLYRCSSKEFDKSREMHWLPYTPLSECRAAVKCSKFGFNYLSRMRS